MNSFTVHAKNFFSPRLFFSKLFYSIVALAIGGCSDESVVGPNGQILGLDSWGGMIVHNVTTIVEVLGKTD